MLRFLRPRVRRDFNLPIHRRERTAADVDDELRLHLELRVEQLVASGWTRADAEAEARRRFGPSWDDAVRELHRSGQAREERLAMRERLDTFWQDVRYAARALRRAPRYTAAAVLTLALGLGATTVVFSLVDRIVLRPMPYADPGRLVVVREVLGGLRHVYPSLPANGSHFLAWRKACRSCEGLAAIKRAPVTLTAPGADPVRLGAARVSPNLFRLLGVRPALGRGFRDEEEVAGQHRVAILSDAFWRRQYGADRTIVGRMIRLNDAEFEVVGVLPPGAGLPGGDGLGPLVGLARELDLYRPLAFSEHEATTEGEFDYAVIARLRPGATAAHLQAELDAMAAEALARLGVKESLTSMVTPLHAQVVGGAGQPLYLLLAAVAAVLLIVCANLTNLTLARNASRMRESAVRVAIGASRGRLTRLALTESVVLALAGGLLGLALAWWGLRALVAMAPPSLPRLGEVALDGRLFGAAMLLTLLVGLMVGALPALRLARAHPGEALKSGGRTSTGGRAAARRRAGFIAAQVALSTILLVGTGLFLASFVRVLRVDRGFATEGVIALDVALPPTRYDTEERRQQYFDRALAELAAVPGIAAVGLTSGLPLEGETWVDGIAREQDAQGGAERPSANIRFVSPGYFAAVGTPIRQGREVATADRGRRVAVVSERVARTLWPGESAIGKRLIAGPTHTATEVVGVAADMRTSTLEQEGSLVVYLPAWEWPPSQATIVARTSTDVAGALSSARGALRRIDPGVAVPKLRTMSQVVAESVAARRFQVALLVLLAVLAFVTASIGIYGVIAQSLASRGGEIAVRMALGARSADIHRLVLREGMTPVAIGLAAGIAGSIALGGVVAGLLFEVRPGDPATIGGVTALLAAVATVACVVPARRATATELPAMLRLE